MVNYWDSLGHPYKLAFSGCPWQVSVTFSSNTIYGKLLRFPQSLIHISFLGVSLAGLGYIFENQRLWEQDQDRNMGYRDRGQSSRPPSLTSTCPRRLFSSSLCWFLVYQASTCEKVKWVMWSLTTLEPRELWRSTRKGDVDLSHPCFVMLQNYSCCPDNVGQTYNFVIRAFIGD